MRVAIVSFHRGGMAHYAAMLSRSVAAADPEGAVAGFCCEDITPSLFAPRTEFFRFPVPQELRPSEIGRFFKMPQVVRKLARVLETWSPDLIHINSGHLWYAGLVSALAHRYPLVATLHDVHVHPGEWRPYERFKLRPLINHARQLLVHSKSLREKAARRWKLAADRLVIVPCGLLMSTPPRTDVKEKPHQVLFAGRLYAYKGLEVLLRAWPTVQAECPAAQLLIAGAGRLAPWRHALHSFKSGIQIVNRYLSDDELGRFLAESAVITLPYLEASQSGLALMATAHGKAVVASRVGAIPDVIRHQETGLLVEPGNAVALAEAIVHLLRNPAERQRLGRSASDAGHQRFGPEAVGAQLLKVYHSAVNGEAP